MYDFAEKPQVWIPVRWPGLIQREPAELAEPIEYEIHCLVELVDTDRLTEIDEKFNRSDLSLEDRRHTEREAFKELVADWRGVKQAGKDLPLSDENIDRLIKRPGFSTGFNTAFIEAMNGRIETREGNSKGSPASGPAADPEQPKTS